MLVLTLLSCSMDRYQTRASKSPSLLDIPDQGLYYCFIMNQTSHFIEASISSLDQKKTVYPQIILFPSRYTVNVKKKDGPSEYLDRSKYAYRPPNVKPIWLKLGRYSVQIRQRDDLIGEKSTGPMKTFVVVLDQEYVEKAPGPLVLEIVDEPRKRGEF